MVGDDTLGDKNGEGNNPNDRGEMVETFLLQSGRQSCSVVSVLQRGAHVIARRASVHSSSLCQLKIHNNLHKKLRIFKIP